MTSITDCGRDDGHDAHTYEVRHAPGYTLHCDGQLCEVGILATKRDANEGSGGFRDLACNFTIDGKGECGHVYLRHDPRKCDKSLERGLIGKKS